MPQFSCLAQSTQAPSNSTLEPTFKVADVAVMSTACRPNPTTSKQVSSQAHDSSHSGTSHLTHGEELATHRQPNYNLSGALRHVSAVCEVAAHMSSYRELKDKHDDLSKSRSKCTSERLVLVTIAYMTFIALLSIMTVTYTWSSKGCTHKSSLYGS